MSDTRPASENGRSMNLVCSRGRLMLTMILGQHRNAGHCPAGWYSWGMVGQRKSR